MLPSTAFLNTPVAHVKQAQTLQASVGFFSVFFIVPLLLSSVTFWDKKSFGVINKETLTPKFYLLHFSGTVNPYGNFYR